MTPRLPALRWALTSALLLAAAGAHAQDRAEIDRTQILGNRELPKVLYIVPWKKPLPGQLNGRPVHSVLDEALAPVDRQVFRRQVDYAGQLQARAAKAQDPTAPSVPANPAPAPTGAPR